MNSQKCKKCDFESHSVGLLRRHKVAIHNMKETYENIIIGFEFDVDTNIEVMKAMDEGDIKFFKCENCDFNTHSKGKLMKHINNMHIKNKNKSNIVPTRGESGPEQG